MAFSDFRLLAIAVLGIALSIVLIVRGRLHPFVALLCGAFFIGPMAGLSLFDTAKAVQKGTGDVLGGVGLIVALGLALGSMLQLSGGAVRLAGVVIGQGDSGKAPWRALLAAFAIGLPLFFETGLVLLMPIIAGAGMASVAAERRDAARLRLMLSAMTGLSVLHALVPPHPGPLLAVETLHADLGRTLLYGVLVALPTAAIAGPLLSIFTVRGVVLASSHLVTRPSTTPAVPAWRALIVVLLPVVLIAAGQGLAFLPPLAASRISWTASVSHPVVALLIACLVALPLLFGRRMGDADVQKSIWQETVAPAGAILLAIGAGGAMKQVLVGAGLSDMLARFAASGSLSPILLAWLVAVSIRLATGSATVATITAAGALSGVASLSGVSPEWIVLAIGAGSVFFSHVNDPGFWLVKGFLGTDTAATFRTWSALETVISVTGLILVLVFSRLF